MPRPTTVLGGTGFDRGGMTVVNRYATSIETNASLPAIQTGTGRRSGNCLRINYACKVVFTLSTGDDEFWLLIAMRPNTLPSVASRLLTLTRAGVVQCSLGIATDGRITAGTATATTGLGTTTTGFSAGFFSQVALYVKCHNSTGQVKAYWNGSLTADATMDGTSTKGLGDTQSAGDTIIDGFYLGNGSGGSTSTLDLDDMLFGIGADLGTTGDLALAADVPQSDGTHVDLTCTTGTNRTAMVNDTTPDVDDSSTISATAGEQTFNYTALAYTPASVAAVITKVMAKKNDAGTRTISDFLDNGTEYTGTAIDLATDYRVIDLIRQDIAAAALTKTNIDAAEWGIALA